MAISAEQTYLFRHVLMRDAAYQLFPPAARASLHAIVLEVCDSLLGGDAEALGPFAAELADHAEAAGAHDKLLDLRLHAARYASNRYRNAEAISHLERALSLTALLPAKRIEIAVSLGKHLLSAGMMPRLRDLLDEVLPGLDPDSPERHVLLLFEADFLYLTQQTRLAGAAYDRAAEIARARGDTQVLSNIICNRAILLCDTWEFEQALAEFRQAHALNEQAEAGAGLGRTQSNIAYALQRLGREDEALAAYDAALILLEKANNPVDVANTLSNRGLLYRRQGKQGQALASFEAAARSLRSLGEKYYLSHALGNIGMVLLEEDRLQEAAEYATQAHEAALEGANRYTVGMSLVVLSTALRGMGRWEEAAEGAERSAYAVSIENHRAFVIQAELNNAEVSLSAGRLEQARRAAKRVNELAHQPMLRLMARLALAQVGQFEGDYRQALDCAAALVPEDDAEIAGSILFTAIRAACAMADLPLAHALETRIEGIVSGVQGLEHQDAAKRLAAARVLIGQARAGTPMRRGYRQDEVSGAAWKLLGESA